MDAGTLTVNGATWLTSISTSGLMVSSASAPIPSQVKVGPYVYSVLTDEASLRKHEHDRNGGLRGCTDHQALQIFVGPDLAPGMQRQTLWHEVKHAIVDSMTMSNDKRVDEDWISRTAPGELAVLRNNPDLVAFLLAGD